MNTPMPPTEPLDATEREFARVLRALPGGEPPAALDAAILRAASNAAAAQRRPGARLLASAGAMWGIGTAAAAVLALGVAWQMRYGAPDHAPAEAALPQAQMVSDREEDDAVTVELGEGRADAPASAPPPAPTASTQPMATLPRRAPVRAPAAPAAPPPPPALAEPYPADQLDEHVARDAINPVDASSVESTTVLSQEQKARAETRERESGYAAKAASAPAPVAAEAAAGADSASGGAQSQANALGGLASTPRQEAVPMKPATWLQEIRRLRDAGRIPEARARLVEFRRAYPNWVVPTDLAPLLSE